VLGKLKRSGEKVSAETVVPKFGQKLLLSVLAQDGSEVLEQVGTNEAELEVIEQAQSTFHQCLPFPDGQEPLETISSSQVGAKFLYGLALLLLHLKTCFEYARTLVNHKLTAKGFARMGVLRIVMFYDAFLMLRCSVIILLIDMSIGAPFFIVRLQCFDKCNFLPRRAF